jgi:ectoine hydroxylase-related dioxygenase (phytanoyl-CoA dioxygenase family)
MIRLSDSYQRIVFADNKQSIAQFAAWPNLHLQHPDIIFKGGYDRLPPHQEFNYSRGSIDSLVAWSPLFAVSVEHFPLEIIEGSHKKGLIPHKLIGANTALDTLNSDDYKDHEFTRLAVDVGDVVLFSSFLIHRTGKNYINEVDLPVRIAANFQFNNLLEQSIIGRSYQLSDSVLAPAERFDPTPFIIG